MTVQLDVTGPGLGVVTHSTPAGEPVRTERVVLQGWTARYLTSPHTPIILTVDPSPLGQVRCAVHVDGRLIADDSSREPNCSVADI